MNKIIQLVTPDFVNKLDQQLLEKHPFLWSKRLIHVLFFGSIILGFNIALCVFKPINVFSYTPMWVFIWFSTVPAILFLLVWLFFQYKYELAWDYAKLGWGYYFKTGASYVLVCTLTLAMVIAPLSIYQYRLNTFYNNSISIVPEKKFDTSHSIATTYLDEYYPSDTDISSLKGDYLLYEEAKEKFLNTIFSRLDYFSSQHDIDSLIKPEIEKLYSYDAYYGLTQVGDTTHRYVGTHLWLVFFDDSTTNSNNYVEGKLHMFSPAKYFKLNQERVLARFDSSDYQFNNFFTSNYLTHDNMPSPHSGGMFYWQNILSDSTYYIETQTVNFYDKKEVDHVKDERLGISYPKYVFVTDLVDQNTQFKEYYIGANVRGNTKLFRRADFYELKRFEYLLHQRFNIERLDELTYESVSDNVEAFQAFSKLLYLMERDYGTEFVQFKFEISYAYLCGVYVVSAVLALILLTMRLLNFKLLVLSIISLAIVSFIVFVPMAALSIKPYHFYPLLFLSVIFMFLIYSVVRINLAKSVSKLMIVMGLSGLITLPLITLFYFFYIVKNIEFVNYEDRFSFTMIWGTVISILFVIGHIPLIARTIFKSFILPKR